MTKQQKLAELARVDYEKSVKIRDALYLKLITSNVAVYVSNAIIRALDQYQRAVLGESRAYVLSLIEKEQKTLDVEPGQAAYLQAKANTDSLFVKYQQALQATG